MEVYLLEIYENKTANIPEFGLIFKNMDLLLKFVETHIKKLEPEYLEYAKDLKETGLSLSLNEEETVRISILPVIENVEEDKYDKYFTLNKPLNLVKHEDDLNKHRGQEPDSHEGKEEEKNGVLITHSDEIVELPEGTKNTLTDDNIKTGDTIVDVFHYKNMKENPRYMLEQTYEHLDVPKRDPWSRSPISEATTYKVKTNNSRKNSKNRSNNTTKKNNRRNSPIR